MKASFRIVVTILGLALVAGCGSTPPSRYYMLSADAAEAPTGDGLAIGVGPITIPDYLKSRGMILSREQNRLEISEFDRWAEPLESGITRVLTLNLSAMLDTRKVVVFPWRTDAVPAHSVQVNLAQFTARQEDAILVASWTIQRPRTGDHVMQSITQYTLPLDSHEPNEVADVYSALLLLLSEDIADAIKQDANAS